MYKHTHVHAHTHVRTHTHVHARMRTHTCMRTRTHACMHTHTRTRACAHIHTHIHTHTHGYQGIKQPHSVPGVQYTHTHTPVFSSRYGESCHRAAIVCPGHHDASYSVGSLKVNQVSCSTHTGRLERKIGQWVYTIINYTCA